MKSLVAALAVAVAAACYPVSAFASAAPDLFGIIPGMDVTDASKKAKAQIQATKFVNLQFANGKPAGFEAFNQAGAGNKEEAFRVDTPPSGIVTFLSRAVDYGHEVGPTTEDLLRDLEAKYGRYSNKENVGAVLLVLVWRYGKDWQIQGSTSRECSAMTLKSDVSGSLPIYTPPDKARNCDPFMRVAIQSNPDTKTVQNYSVTIFDERRMYLEMILPPGPQTATH